MALLPCQRHEMLYLAGKALHIIGFISWFAGLFYIPRLFIYHAEAGARPDAERVILQRQLELMQVRLWRIITVPAAIVTFIGGSSMVVQLLMAQPGLPGWLYWKFGWLTGLVVYHLMCRRILDQQAEGSCTWTSSQLRVFNEVATVMMVAIVCLAVFKSNMSAIYGALGLLLLGLLLSLGIRVYRRLRERHEAAPPGASRSGVEPC